MQTSDKKTCFQLSECSLSYAKILFISFNSKITISTYYFLTIGTCVAGCLLGKKETEPI